MADSENALSGAIGARVRQERKVRGWTLDRLAEISGVSRRMVVSIKQGSANPSIGTLLRISDALGVGLPALVEPPEGYGEWLTDLKARIHAAQQRAAITVNTNSKLQQ